jgi:hypothetical protein
MVYGYTLSICVSEDGCVEWVDSDVDSDDTAIKADFLSKIVAFEDEIVEFLDKYNCGDSANSDLMADGAEKQLELMF